MAESRLSTYSIPPLCCVGILCMADTMFLSLCNFQPASCMIMLLFQANFY